MKDFRTALSVIPSDMPMHLGDAILTQGSCFSDAIGHRLASHKMNAAVNPFGVIYNPESIHKVLSCSIFNEPLPEHTFLQNHGVHLNYNFHSAFSSLRKDELATRLTNSIGSTHYFLKDARWILITYGTAWVYSRNDTGEIVANCHKLPSSMFTKSLMSAASITDSFKGFYAQLKKFNPHARIILTLSPVRHLKDTLELNSVSKSILRVACHELADSYDDVDYFPAYEIMMDDLRDYRFYKSDMLHPTEEAENYIWDKFMERYFSPGLKDFILKWGVILSALRHRPFHPESSAHQQFLRSTLRKLEELRELVNVDSEAAAIKEQIVN
jgi:hypothetical protein